jgi:uncharacterized protein involved in exopolysaccharide biosynthesis
MVVTDEMMEELAERVRCRGTNAGGEPCASPEHLVAAGYCPAHRNGGQERMREIGILGGNAKAAKEAGQAFTAEELTALVDLDDAMRALDAIRVAAMSRRLTHAEANAASKAVSEWVKAYMARTTQRLVNELQAELTATKQECAELRQQLTSRQRLGK